MNKIIKGTLISGHGVASGKNKDDRFPNGTIAMQKPFFKELGLDLSKMFMGTLNVKFDVSSYSLDRPDYLFKEMKWSCSFPAETFSFVRCEILFKNECYKGLIYYPHKETKVEHFQEDSMIEIIAPKINNIEYGDSLSIRLDQSKITFTPNKI